MTDVSGLLKYALCYCAKSSGEIIAPMVTRFKVRFSTAKESLVLCVLMPGSDEIMRVFEA